MYIVGSDRCQVWVEEPAALTLALFVRDVAGLTPPLDYLLPPLDPGVRFWPIWGVPAPAGWRERTLERTRLVDPALAGREWVRWWGHLTADLPAAAQEFRGPAFAAYRRVPTIRTLLQRHYDEAGSWLEAVDADPRIKRDQATPRPGLAGLITDLACAGAVPRPFKLRLSIVPLAGKHAWPLAPEHILITRNLVADADNALDWLRPRIAALARGGSVLTTF